MSKNRYHVGISLHRRKSLLWVMLERRVMMSVVVVVALFGFGLTSALNGLHVFGRPSGSEVSRKQYKTPTSKSTVISNARAAWLKVQPVVTAASTATPVVQQTDVVVTVPLQLAAVAVVDTPVVAPTAKVDVSASDLVSPAPVSTTTPVVLIPTASQVASADTAASVQISAALPATTPTDAAPRIVVNTTQSALPTIEVPTPTGMNLDNPVKKDIAMQLVSSAENSSLNWKAQYGYIQDIGDGRGYTGGIIGFCSGTSDMLALVQYYTHLKPGNPLAAYIPALQKVNGTSSHTGLGDAYVQAWQSAASDPAFQQAQNDERDRVYFNPAVTQAKTDGLRALGQFAYYDALVMHGPGSDASSFGGIRAAALKKAKTPAQGGDEATYLHAFLDARVAAMKTEAAHDDVSRVETAQRVFLNAGNFDLNTPLAWKVYGDPYSITY